MYALSALNKYFWKYKFRFLAGIFFVITSNYLAVLVPEITGYIIGKLQASLPGGHLPKNNPAEYDPVIKWFTGWMEQLGYARLVMYACVALLLMSLLRGVLMFFMRQTLIVMSRHIEYEQKNEVFSQYQRLDTEFFKSHTTGDLMNRIAEDVGRIRAYTGPAIMYLINMVTLIVFCIINMLRKDVHLTLLTLAPLPVLGITIYIVNNIIHKKSQRVQELLSDLTTNAQESYSGIRVIKSYVQEKAMLGFFRRNSEEYRQNAVGLAKTEAVYFPSMMLIIGLSTLVTILAGAQMALQDPSKIAVVVEFVIYVNMLTYPVGAIGWVASMIQRAAASQKRLNEFLDLQPKIESRSDAVQPFLKGEVCMENVSFTYPNTGIEALKNFNLHILPGQKVLIIGKTGSGKTTIAQLLLRFYDVDSGKIILDGNAVRDLDVQQFREQISYVPQDVFLFSDTVAGNINFGLDTPASHAQIEAAAKFAGIADEIEAMPQGYGTLVGERGVTLSGGQKQRISIARALIKDPQLMLFDDCLSAVDNKTEHIILGNLAHYLSDRTAIIITHRIFTAIHFDQIIILGNGHIVEQGTHEELMRRNGYYAELYRLQITEGK